MLASCYRASLALAREHGLETVAFPAISTGAYRFPITRAAGIAVREVAAALSENTKPERVIFVVRGDEAEQAYRAALAALPRSGGLQLGVGA